MQTFRTVEITDTTISIGDARLPTAAELDKLADWYKPMCLVGVGEPCKLKSIWVLDALKILNRKNTHSFRGCSNQVWILTPVEEQALVNANTQAAATIAAREKSEDAELIVNPAYAGLSREELAQKENQYDRVMNEGGEGFNPYRDNYWIVNPTDNGDASA